MNLRVFVPTVGEGSTPETIRRIQQYLPPHYLTIWCEAIARPTSHFFEDELARICFSHGNGKNFDLIASDYNHGITEVINFSFMCMEWDYLLIVPADVWLEQDAWAKLYSPFENFEKVACSGGWRGPMDAPLIWAKQGFPDTYPDGPLLISRAAVNAIGALSPSFHGHSQGFFDWHMRAQTLGWKEAIVDKVFTEQGNWHEGRDKNPNAHNEVQASEKVLARVRERGFAKADWWRSDL